MPAEEDTVVLGYPYYWESITGIPLEEFLTKVTSLAIDVLALFNASFNTA